MPGWMRKTPWKRKKGTGKAKRADDRGVSFVEVIVSMLIMAIAVIPLLGSFMMSLRVNMKSRQAMAATIVAQNVMECVKEYANAHTVIGGFAEDSDMKDYLPEYYVKGSTKEEEGYFAPKTTAIGFTLSNIREGVNDYYVDVTYDQTAFSAGGAGINDRDIPDLTTLDADTTVIICPAGVVNGSLENAARNYFFEQWVSGQWLANANVEGYSGPREEERAWASNDISLRMTSELTIEVSGTKEMPKVEAVLRYGYDGMTYSAYSVESNAGMKKLENIYVFYDPLKITGNASSGYQIDDMVQIKNAGGFSWNLFFAVQESDACLGASYDTSKLSGPVFAMDWLYNGDTIALYCSAKLQSDQRISVNGETKLPNNPKLENKNSLVETTSDVARMQRVTVEVYRQGTNEKLASMETDILQ